jgi:Amt family ammonium transporter
VRVRPRLGLDDSLDVVAVHGVAATLGAILTGLLATKVVNPDAADGSVALMGIQAIGVVATWIWSGVLSFVLLKIIGAVTALRAEDEDEWSGMDMVESGERAYITTDVESSAAEAQPAVAGHAPALQHAHLK